MKKLHYFLLVAFLALVTLPSTAQITYIPDNNFEQALIDLGLDTGPIDGKIPTANLQVQVLEIQNKNITNLSGIEDNQVLTYLDCSDNKLVNLDLSKNRGLYTLHCQYNKLTSLDVSKNIYLKDLACSGNSISILNLSENPDLEELDCRRVLITSLDLSKNQALTVLYCETNNSLSTLDLRNGHNAELNVFWGKESPNLTCIYVDNKNGSYLSSWSKDASSTFVNDESECTYSYIADDNFLRTIITKGYGIGMKGNNVPKANIDAVDFLNIPNENIADLTGIAGFSALSTLFCYDNQLTSLDLSKNVNLVQLYCYNNKLTRLDVSKNKGLVNFLCYNNKLTSLDVSTNTALVSFDCSSNILSSLNLSNNTALKNLKCNYNGIKNLDLSNNYSLQEVRCFNNQLVSLDIRNGNNENITHFDAEYNPDLTCIYVDSDMEGFSGWTKDASASFVNNESECNALPITQISAEEFSIYPNPTNGVVNLDLAGKQIQNLKLVDVTGKIISEKSRVNSIETIDLSNFANGLYLVILQTENGTQSFKVIKE